MIQIDEWRQRVTQLVDELYAADITEEDKFVVSSAVGNDLVWHLRIVAKAREVKLNFDEKIRGDR